MSAEPVSLRDEQRSRTRSRILGACVELAVRHGGFSRPELFTYAKVAEIAGVSERTVYRLFPTKHDLVEAYVTDRTLVGGRQLPATAAELGSFVRAVTHDLAATYPPVRPEPALAPQPDEDGTASADADRAHRDAALLARVAPLLPIAATDDQRRAVAAVIRSLASVRTAVESAERAQADLATTGDAFAWAIDTLITALSRGDLPTWSDA